MWGIIGTVLNILWLILKNKFEKDAEERKRKEELHAEATKAILSRNPSAIVGVLDRMRNK